MRDGDRRRRARWLATVAVLAMAGAAGAYGLAGPPDARADATGQGGDYVALNGPARLVDTRTGVGLATGAKKPGTYAFQVTGRGGVPAGGVRAVFLDATILSPTATTGFNFWPDGNQQGGAGVTTGSGTVSNSVLVAVGTNGRIALNVTGGTAHAVIDVHGYVTTSSAASGPGGFVPVFQTRIVDTRSGLGMPMAKIATNGTATAQITGVAGVPSGANAAFVVLTVVGAPGSGPLVAYPAGGSNNNSTFDFTAGTSSSGAVVKLSSTGRLTVKNLSAGAINLVIDIFGYSTAQSTTGAGFRVNRARVLDTRDNGGLPIRPDATVNIRIGGANGLPTRGIAGAALNFTVTSGTAGGVLAAWPNGLTEPGTGLTHWGTGDMISTMMVVRPGADGVIKVRNRSEGTVHIIVDQQGWFADPIPTAAIDPYSATTVLQTAPFGAGTAGPIEYAYVDNIGRLLHGYQPSPGDFFGVQWTVISGGEAFTGTPSMIVEPDKTVRVVAHQTSTDVWTRNHAGVQNYTWGTFRNTGGSMAHHPAVAKLPSGLLVMFAVDADGRLWSNTQATVNGDFSYWHRHVDINLTGTPTVVTLRDRVQLFARDTGGVLRTATFDGTTLSAFSDLGGSGFIDRPAVVVLPGFRLWAFAKAADGRLMSQQQTSAGTFPGVWTPVGSFVATGMPSPILSPLTGRLEIVARDAVGDIYYTRETAQGTGEWAEWELKVSGSNTATDPTAFSYVDNNTTTWGFAIRTAINENVVYSIPQNLGGVAALTDTGPAFVRQALPAPPR